MPCSNCATAETPCEIRESRRGKHPRHSSSHSKASISHCEVPEFAEATPRLPAVIVPPAQVNEHVAASQALATLRRNGSGNTDSDPSPQQEGTPATDSRSPTTLPQHTVSRPDDEQSVFLGESTSIRYLSEPSPPAAGPSPPQSIRFLHSVPNVIKAASIIPQWEAERRQAKIEALRAEGVFSYPPKVVVKELLKGYFQWFHPCFAIVDELDIWNQYEDGTIPHLLLQSMLFIGCLHCDEDYLQQVGLGSRRRAKYRFYNRAKDIYDIGYEEKRLVVIQSLFLLSFWRDGALFEKDVRHWLGATISLAQTKGFHRNAGTGETKADKLRRRMWWSIYTRERQCAAALGLPNRFRDEDCDVGVLTKADFESAFHPSTPPHKVDEYVSYSIGMCHLSKTLGQICHCGYLPSKVLSSSDRNRMREELIQWKEKLPRVMQLSNSDFDAPPSFYANMLHLSYNNLLILLYRAGYIGGPGSSEVDGTVALQAASRNSRIVEDMLPEGDLRHAHVHVITNLFNTLCVHTFCLREAKKGTAKAIAEYRAKLCLIGLQELQKTWEVQNWVLQLFFHYLDRQTAARLQVQDDSMALSNGMGSRGAAHAQRTGVATPNTLPMYPIHEADTRMSAAASADTPWSWSTEEANQFLFSQIESEFAFGEGGLHMMSLEEDFNMDMFSMMENNQPMTDALE